MQAAKFKKYFFVLLLLELLFAYASAYAQNPTPYDYSRSGVSEQIKRYLCAPSDVDSTQRSITNLNRDQAAFRNANSGDLYRCINQLYKFAIVLASVVGVFFIVIAGYVYMAAEGNQESVDKAKSILTSTIASLVILFSGYILLKAINPDLIQFRSIQPPSVRLSNFRNFGRGGGTGSGIGSCQPLTSGPASTNILQATCFGGNAVKASSIANVESGGETTIGSGVDKCEPGGEIVSWGLFQINISANRIGNLNCPSAFNAVYTGSNHNCRVINQTLYNQCVQAAKDASQNIQTSCQLSNNGQNWSAWGANRICGF